jgi:IclR family KDG regulon transcriptional repressor
LTTRTLSRGLDILERLASAGEFGLGPSAVAEEAGLDKATVSRLLRTLVEAGYVRQDSATRKYRLTGKLIRLAQGVAASLDLQRVARPHLMALRDRVGETVNLGVLEDLSVYYVDKLESENSIRLVSDAGRTMPLHSTALGKAILSVLPESERDELCQKIKFVRQTDRTICDLEQFEVELRTTRTRGYAIDDQENEPLATCVAAAIVGPDGRPAGAISVSAPHFRVQDHINELGIQVMATAAQVTWELGAVPSPSDAVAAAARRENEPASWTKGAAR